MNKMNDSYMEAVKKQTLQLKEQMPDKAKRFEDKTIPMVLETLQCKPGDIILWKIDPQNTVDSRTAQLFKNILMQETGCNVIAIMSNFEHLKGMPKEAVIQRLEELLRRLKES